MENSRVSRCPLRFWSVHRRKFLAFRVVRFAFGGFTVGNFSRFALSASLLERSPLEISRVSRLCMEGGSCDGTKIHSRVWRGSQGAHFD